MPKGFAASGVLETFAAAVRSGATATGNAGHAARVHAWRGEVVTAVQAVPGGGAMVAQVGGAPPLPEPASGCPSPPWPPAPLVEVPVVAPGMPPLPACPPLLAVTLVPLVVAPPVALVPLVVAPPVAPLIEGEDPPPQASTLTAHVTKSAWPRVRAAGILR
jgi:hypothetical protein